ncbi:MAG: hypothetical protein JW938_05095 [Candidatus Omnitrophica bacterium]|nr:hypothetical protein [Candidatus Omnitrophota bacterium]
MRPVTINKTIAICSAGELFGGVELWVLSFAERVSSPFCSVQRECWDEKGQGG